MKITKPVLILLSLVLLSACGRIESGNTGVRTSFTGKVNEAPMEQGFYTAILSSVQEYSAKEITVELFDMTPKAKDNLSLKDMDIEVYYTVRPADIPKLKVKYAGRDAYDNRVAVWYSAYELVRSFAREKTYDVVSQYNSLDIHKDRETLSDSIRDGVQIKLNESDPGVFDVKKVVIRNIVTDPSVENAIRLAVAKNKELEAQQIQIEIAKKQADANIALNESLTPSILKNKELDILKQCVEDKCGTFTVLIGAEKATPFYSVNK